MSTQPLGLAHGLSPASKIRISLAALADGVCALPSGVFRRSWCADARGGWEWFGVAQAAMYGNGERLRDFYPKRAPR